VIKDSVNDKLSFAKKRLDEICHLVTENKISVDANLRQQLAQEFFFHLLGAVEYLAQLVNESRALGVGANEVLVYKISDKLKQANSSDPLISILDSLAVNTKKELFPTDPFSNYSLMYRLINYRNEVVHRNTNPYHFVLSAGSRFAEFWLDPRDHSLGKTGVSVDVDLTNMFNFVKQQIQNALLHV
jgi:hypothetical protein